MIIGCTEEDNPAGPSGGKRDIAMSMGIGEGMFFGTTPLDGTTQDGSDFYEHNAQSTSMQWGSWLFVTEPMTSGKLYRYTIGADNILSGPLELSLGAGSGTSNISVASANKAYVSLHNSGKIAVINPTAMMVSGEIDLTNYSVSSDGSPDPSTSIIRDNLLYVALSQRASVMSAHDTAACVAIIDITTDAVIKVIWDSRATSLGGPDESNCTVFMDESRNIYFYSYAMWGYQPGIRDGILRIKNGETEFDTSFYMGISGTMVGAHPVSYGLTIRYAGNGIAYSSLLVPALTSNPPDYLNDRNYQPVKIDLTNKIITALPIQPVSGWVAKAILVEKSGTVIFGQNQGSTSPMGLYRYDPATNTLNITPVLKTSGMPYHLFALQE
jgi:hypothetical protein